MDETAYMEIESGDNQGTYYFFHDGLGSVTDILDSSGNRVNAYDYYAYGEDYGTPTEGISNRYKFANREHDTWSSNYYNRNRYYNYSNGRFGQRDSLGMGWYYYPTPTLATDPTGMFAVTNPAANDATAVTVTDSCISCAGLNKLTLTPSDFGAHPITNIMVEDTLDDDTVFVEPPSGWLGEVYWPQPHSLIRDDGNVKVKPDGAILEETPNFKLYNTPCKYSKSCLVIITQFFATFHDSTEPGTPPLTEQEKQMKITNENINRIGSGKKLASEKNCDYIIFGKGYPITNIGALQSQMLLYLGITGLIIPENQHKFEHIYWLGHGTKSQALMSPNPNSDEEIHGNNQEIIKLEFLKNYLTDSGEVTLYSCYLGKHPEGRDAFGQSLSTILQRNVNAFTDTVVHKVTPGTPTTYDAPEPGPNSSKVTFTPVSDDWTDPENDD